MQQRNRVDRYRSGVQETLVSGLSSGHQSGVRLPVPSLGERAKGKKVAESVYKIIELVGTSKESWEKAAAAAVRRASASLRDLRVAEISQLDIALKDGKIEAYRAKVKVSFKYEGGS
jgi:hypothetical protein